MIAGTALAGEFSGDGAEADARTPAGPGAIGRTADRPAGLGPLAACTLTE